MLTTYERTTEAYLYYKLTTWAVFRRTWTDVEELLKEKSFFILSFVFLSEIVIRQVQTQSQVLVSDCRFGVSPVNYPELSWMSLKAQLS